MGYMHIDNLYKAQDVLLFKDVYALEKIHGTSAHVSWSDGVVHFFAGGGKHTSFVQLFNEDALRGAFAALKQPKVIIFGESYAGKCQGQQHRYGAVPRFVAFDVKIGDLWLAVPDAAKVVEEVGLEFVHYVPCAATVEALDEQRDAPSEQAKRNGISEPQRREGIVIRPLIELRKNDGSRIIAKYKRDDERETRTPRDLSDPAKLQVLADAHAVAQEWVTLTRLAHVLDKLPLAKGVEDTGDVIKAIVEDVIREAAGEIVDSREVRAAIGRATAILFKQSLKATLSRSSESPSSP